MLNEANDQASSEKIINELKELEGHLVSSGQSILDWFDTAESMFADALDAASERFSYFTNQLEHNEAIATTIKELFALQGQTYKTLAGFERLQRAGQARLDTQVA